jgi:hypothetical protein
MGFVRRKSQGSSYEANSNNNCFARLANAYFCIGINFLCIGCVIAGKSWAAWLLLGAYGGGIFSIVFAVVYTIIRIATLLIHRKASRL